MNTEKCRLIFERLAHAIPDPTTELHYTSTFELLVAVMLSAQATDKSVNLATAQLFPVAHTPQAILDLGLERLQTYIQRIGLYKTKAQNLLKTCQMLLAEYQGEVPDTREALERLPGVGRKTANVILNTAFGEPTIAVDTHIFRLANRIGLVRGKTPLEVELKLLKITPTMFLRDAHHLLILHGRYVCVARKPHCTRCVIHDLCDYPAREGMVQTNQSAGFIPT